MTTLRDMLNKLPSPHREAAIKNTSAAIREEECCGPVHGALSCAFVWGNSPEGHEFWMSVRDALQRSQPLPELPAATTVA